MKINITHQLKKYLPHLLKAKEDNLNEADTLQRIVKVFEDVLGYDALSDIACEMEVRSKYVDRAIKVDGVTKFLVEAKSAATTLRDRHIEQGERYAAEANIQWVLLTNGVMWNLYHLTFDEGIEYEPVFSVDFETMSIDSKPAPFEKLAEVLGLLHHGSIKVGAHEEYWEQHAALSPESIGKAIFTEDVILFIRREIRRREGILIAPEDLVQGIHCLFTPEAQQKIGPPKMRIKKTAKPNRSLPSDSEPTAAAPPEIPTSPVIQFPVSGSQNISPPAG